MAGTTPTLGFPYPTGTDRLMDGDNAMQALAEAIENYFVGADAAITAGASMTLGATNRAYRRGKMVTMLVDDWTTTGAIASGATIATLPAGYRPPVTVRGVVANFTDSLPVSLIILNTGAVQTSNAIPTTKVLKGSVTFPI